MGLFNLWNILLICCETNDSLKEDLTSLFSEENRTFNENFEKCIEFEMITLQLLNYLVMITRKAFRFMKALQMRIFLVKKSLVKPLILENPMNACPISFPMISHQHMYKTIRSIFRIMIM